MTRTKKYLDELIGGVRLALEGERPIAQIAADLGMHPETLRKKVRPSEGRSRRAAGVDVEFGARGAQAPAARELRDPQIGRFGVEPICRSLEAATATFR